MKSAFLSRIVHMVAGSFAFGAFFIGLPSNSASALAAWALGDDGVLVFRTSKGANLKAFYQAADDIYGARLWVDFPGELIRPRRLKGTGPVNEIRLGKPTPGFTRFVVEFNPSVVLDPTKLRLLGVSPDRWALRLNGLSTRGLRTIGEGNLLPHGSKTLKKYNSLGATSVPLNLSTLPVVPRGRYRVVIDPGHGGPDPGAVGVGGIRESDVVLDISLQVAKLLKAKGVKVNLTRTTEVDLDLPPRVALANRLGASAFVSIHANASRVRNLDVNGIETFFFAGSSGNRLAANIQKQVLNVSPGSPDRGVRKGRFFVIRRTTMPAVLVETGFLTGRLDGKRLAKAPHRRKLALAIAKGILNYLRGLS